MHISSFANRNRRPAENDLVTYKLATDPEGRLQAVEVELVGVPARPALNYGPLWRAMALTTIFFAALVAAVAIGVYPGFILGIYFGASVVAFLMYWYDKLAARSSIQRTAENTLHAIGLLGGWPGSLVAMQVFRHKSRKVSFRWTFWLTVLINCGVLVWLASPSGAKVVASVLGSP